MDPAAIEASPRRRRFATRHLMAVVVGVGCVLGWLAGMERARRSVKRVMVRFVLQQMDQERRQEPRLGAVGYSWDSGWTWDGYMFEYHDQVKTPAGKLIATAAYARSSVFGSSGRIVFSTGGRAVTWPVGDILDRRPIDLRALFPEAFRPPSIVRPPAPAGNPRAGGVGGP